MNLSRRVALGASLAAMVLTGLSSAFADESDMLPFRIIFQKDDVIIGLTEGQLTAAGGLNAGIVGKMLVASGELAAWHYVVSRNDAGELVLAPNDWISIIANETLRIEIIYGGSVSSLPLLSWERSRPRPR